MSDKTSFPTNKSEALTMLYLQNQDLSGLTPEEIFYKYQDAYKKIHKCNTGAKYNHVEGGV